MLSQRSASSKPQLGEEEAMTQRLRQAAGVPDQGGGGGGEALVNTTAVDLLRRLPGVTEGNYRQLMAAAGSLAGLAAMPVQELERVMGGTLAAKKLREWLDATCPRLDSHI